MSRTVLIGLDGATFTVLDPLTREGVMPFLRDFARSGVRSPLISTPNPLTPPAWTSLMTGCEPGRHGIFDFANVVRHDGVPRCRMATSRDVRCETIWSIASRHGLRVTALNFPLTYPPRPIAGYLVPGFVRWRHLRRSVFPPDLYDRLAALPGFNVKELALDWELERKALQALPRGEYEGWIRFHIRRERQWMQIVRHLMERETTDLIAVMFDGTDKLQHLCWRFLDPDRREDSWSDWEREVRGLCLEYFRQLDGFLREIAGRAGPEARVFLASDHGFGPTGEIFYVNEWLARQGFLAWDPSASASSEDQLNVEGHRDPSTLFDWSRTRACVLTAGGSGVYIRTASTPDGPGVPAPQYDAFRRRLAEAIRGATDGNGGGPIVKRVLFREEAYFGPEQDRAPDLTLVLRDGGSLSVLPSDVVLRPRQEIAGAHRYAGIFLGSGPGLRRGAEVPPFGIADVAAALLYSLGLEIPEDLDGQVPEAVFAPEALRARPVVFGPPTRPPQAFPEPAAETEAEAREEEAIVERLKALGYIE